MRVDMLNSDKRLQLFRSKSLWLMHMVSKSKVVGSFGKQQTYSRSVLLDKRRVEESSRGKRNSFPVQQFFKRGLREDGLIWDLKSGGTHAGAARVFVLQPGFHNTSHTDSLTRFGKREQTISSQSFFLLFGRMRHTVYTLFQPSLEELRLACLVEWMTKFVDVYETATPFLSLMIFPKKDLHSNFQNQKDTHYC